ncbi:hypothetical protein D047_1438B, partial [Vibrio parahaemolyticus VPTS-2010_2]
AVQGRKKFS